MSKDLTGLRSYSKSSTTGVGMNSTQTYHWTAGWHFPSAGFRQRRLDGLLASPAVLMARSGAWQWAA